MGVKNVCYKKFKFLTEVKVAVNLRSVYVQVFKLKKVSFVILGKVKTVKQEKKSVNNVEEEEIF